ncbi:hypothetical protein NSTC745_01593 [Nostoc sp. DSM 114161]|jgi:glycosyltransferase A (GT-A) superfamily protein (DUF2064 family)
MAGVGFSLPASRRRESRVRGWHDRSSRLFNFVEKKQFIIIGTDCPGFNAQILAIAFDKLRTFDLVLGPPIDGGYYLIGLRQLIPELFANIEWGSAQVF